MVVVSSSLHALFCFLFLFWCLFFFFCDSSQVTFSSEYCWLWLSNSSLRISLDIICLLYSSSSFCIWLDVCRTWLYLNVDNPKLKRSFSSQLLFKDFPKIFSKCAMFIRYRRNTNLTKNIVMAVPVTINSTLDNARFLDLLLKFTFKNWDVTQFIILSITKKLTPITIHFHNFLAFFL